MKRKNNDAYGEELWGYYKFKKDFEIVERSDGYFGEPGFSSIYFSEFKDWNPLEKQAIKLAKGRILDIGCGAGRHSLYLQYKGFPVVGIDKSPLAVKICRLRGLKRVKQMRIDEVGTFRPNSFDTIIMMGCNFGLMGSRNNARRILKHFYRISSQKAMIICSTRDPYQTDEKVHLAYHKLNRKQGRMGGQIRMRIRYERCTSDWFDYLFVSKNDLISILKDSGWMVVKYLEIRNNPSYYAILKKE